MTWTYSLSDRGEDKFAVRYQSNAGYTVDGYIVFQHKTNLVWDVDSKAVNAIQANHGKTGLMQSITAAIHEAISIYLANERPPFVGITGYDTTGKRQQLYTSWTKWQFSGYDAEPIRNGVAFVRDGFIPPWRSRTP